jgi:hypothetical protein
MLPMLAQVTKPIRNSSSSPLAESGLPHSCSPSGAMLLTSLRGRMPGQDQIQDIIHQAPVVLKGDGVSGVLRLADDVNSPVRGLAYKGYRVLETPLVVYELIAPGRL